MALVTGPLLSLEASGQVAGSIVFSKWKGRPYVRQLVRPSNPKSAGQVSTRAMFRFLASAWASMTTAQQATWESLAAADTVSPFNAYMAWNMRRWTQGEAPEVEPNFSGSIINPVMGTLTAAGGVREATLEQAVTTPNDIWGIQINRDITTGFTPSKSNTIAIVEYSVDPITWVDSPLAPDTYYYDVRAFTIAGNFRSYVGEQSAVVT